jgi:hypothetical protein
MGLKERMIPVGLLAEHWIAGGVAATVYGMAVAARDLARLELHFSVTSTEYAAVPFVPHQDGGGWLVFADGPFDAVPPADADFRNILGATGNTARRLEPTWAAGRLTVGAHAQSAQGPGGPAKVRLSERWERICLGRDAGFTQSLTP